jgi:rubredoxin
MGRQPVQACLCGISLPDLPTPVGRLSGRAQIRRCETLRQIKTAPIDVILVCVRWHVVYPPSYRHIEEIMEERGVSVDRFLPLIFAAVEKYDEQESKLHAAQFKRSLKIAGQAFCRAGQGRRASRQALQGRARQAQCNSLRLPLQSQQYVHKDSPMKTYQCVVCGFIYDESAGMPGEGIAPGTKWDDIPADWSCPDCGVAKSDFDMVEL